jgi:hypothetical protein
MANYGEARERRRAKASRESSHAGSDDWTMLERASRVGNRRYAYRAREGSREHWAHDQPAVTS